MEEPSSWVEEESSAMPGKSRPGAPKSRKPMTRKEKIMEELKLLEWHKMANDAAIKAALMQNKTLKYAEVDTEPVHGEDDARWMKKVIQQEHIKPLEVNKAFVLEYEAKEKENEERLTAQVERHIGTLAKLRGKLEAKATMKKTTSEYRSWQTDFYSKKTAVMSGKTLQEVENEERARTAELEASGVVQPKKRVEKKATELSNVLESLDKLAELENRITTLEKDNVYERMKDQERPGASRRTVLDFKKGRVPAKGSGASTGNSLAPMSITYNIAPKTKSWQVPVPGITKTRGQGMSARGGAKSIGGGGGTFLTGMDDTDGGGGGGVSNARMRKARANFDATAGQKGLKGRVQNKRSRVREEVAGARKHQQALTELNRRRNEQQIQKRPPRGAAAPRGAASGVRTKNTHLQDFQNQKSKNKQRIQNVRSTGVGGGRGGTGGMRASRTAPTGNTLPRDNRRVPKTTTAGNLTRRTNVPKKRGGDEGGGVPAVGGVGGIRALRNRGGNQGGNANQRK
jgi:hypothetical protein